MESEIRIDTPVKPLKDYYGAVMQYFRQAYPNSIIYSETDQFASLFGSTLNLTTSHIKRKRNFWFDKKEATIVEGGMSGCILDIMAEMPQARLEEIINEVESKARPTT